MRKRRRQASRFTHNEDIYRTKACRSRGLREWDGAYSEPSHLFVKGVIYRCPISKPLLPEGKKGERADIESEQPFLCICTAVIDFA